MSEETKNPRGRPSKGDLAKRSPLALRTTKALKEALINAAAESGRSLAHEIEVRLEASLGMPTLPASITVCAFDAHTFETYLRAAVANGALK